MQEIRARLQQWVGEINRCLEELLPDPDTPPAVIHQSMRYSVLAGGKRLRPILMLETAGLFVADVRPFYRAACAVELIHTYSLVHDDLPAMDDDDYRRGRLTNHKVFGEGMAVLTGDALLTMAFEQLARLPADFPGREERILEAISELAQAIGTRGMIGGQVLDLQAQGKDLQLPALRQIHQWKTGCLFQATVRFPAILLEVSEEEKAALTSYAYHFGIAFQIVDDILDVIGDEAKLGKRTGSDQRQRKATYPALVGLEEARRLAAAAVEQAVEALTIFGDRAWFLAGLAHFILEREH